jgi:hypothetical protein
MGVLSGPRPYRLEGQQALRPLAEQQRMLGPAASSQIRPWPCSVSRSPPGVRCAASPRRSFLTLQSSDAASLRLAHLLIRPSSPGARRTPSAARTGPSR